jgi:hypothetical protein
LSEVRGETGANHEGCSLCCAAPLPLRLSRDIPSTRNNPKPAAQALDDVQLLKAFHQCFGGRDDEINFVDFEVEHRGADIVRKTTVRRNQVVAKESKLTPIRRS